VLLDIRQQAAKKVGNFNMKPRTLLIISGLLLMAGVAVSWATLTSEVIGFSHRIIALGSDELLLAVGGLILLLIGIFGKGHPGKMFSASGLILSILCGMISYKLLVAALPFEQGITTADGLGLSCLRPLAALLGFLGSIMRTSAETAVSVAPVYSESVKPG
jgi:hypothetical protein